MKPLVGAHLNVEAPAQVLETFPHASEPMAQFPVLCALLQRLSLYARGGFMGAADTDGGSSGIVPMFIFGAAVQF